MRHLWICPLALVPLALTGCAGNDTRIHPRKIRACKIMALEPEDRDASRTRFIRLQEEAAAQRADMGFAPYGGPYPAGHVAPEPVRRDAPEFPGCATILGVEGECEMYFDIGRDGRPTNIVPLCDSELFAASAAKTVSQFEYTPATIDGQPVVYPGASARLVFSFDDDDAAGE